MSAQIWHMLRNLRTSVWHKFLIKKLMYSGTWNQAKIGLEFWNFWKIWLGIVEFSITWNLEFHWMSWNICQKLPGTLKFYLYVKIYVYQFLEYFLLDSGIFHLESVIWLFETWNFGIKNFVCNLIDWFINWVPVYTLLFARLKRTPILCLSDHVYCPINSFLRLSSAYLLL